MTQRQIQRIYDQALAIYKEKHFSAYPPEHQTIICTLLAFQNVLKQDKGISVPFEVLNLPFPQPLDSLDEQ